MLTATHDRATCPTLNEAQEANVMLEIAAVATAIAIGIGLGYFFHWMLDRVQASA